MSETQIYEALWQESAPLIARGGVHADPYLGSEKDSRRGLTLIFRPDSTTRAALAQCVREACGVEPTLYGYPSSDMHTTVLSLISCEQNFAISKTDASTYARVVGSCLTGLSAFSVDYRGITATKDGVMAQGFADDDKLNALRDSIRQRLNAAPLRTTMDTRYPLQTAHATLLRFAEPLNNPGGLHDWVSRNRCRHFGDTRVEEIELVVNDWYMTTAHLRKIASYRLR